MKAKTFCSLAVLISLLSNLSYSQYTDSPKIKSKSCFQIMKEQSGNEKSNIVLSIGGGFVGLFEKTERPNGFNIQADLMYPVSEYFALNIGINYTQFPGYHYDYSDIRYNSVINDTVYTRYFGDYPTLVIFNSHLVYHLAILPEIANSIIT